jgi:hypothetical protein
MRAGDDTHLDKVILQAGVGGRWCWWGDVRRDADMAVGLRCLL